MRRTVKKLKTQKQLKFEDALADFEHVTRGVGSAHDYDQIIAGFRRLPNLPQAPTAEVLARFYAVMERLLQFESRPPRALTRTYSADNHIRACAANRIEATLTGERRRVTLPFEAGDLTHRLSGYLAGLKDGRRLDRLAYDVLKNGDTPAKAVIGALAAEVVGADFVVGLDRAFALDRSNLDQGTWPEAQRDIVPLLDDPFYMVRAAAARLLGSLLEDVALNPENEHFHGAPSLAEALAFIGEKEVERGNVASGFIQGLTGFGTLAELVDLRCDIGRNLDAQRFDVRDWALDVTLRRDHSQADAPNVQPWWFYIHEFFSHDPDAVERIAASGDPWLAMMTALEDAPDSMLPMIERLAVHGDPGVSGPVQDFLDRRKR